MDGLLSTIGAVIGVLALLSVIALPAVELYLQRREDREAKARHPIADRWRQPPGGW